MAYLRALNDVIVAYPGAWVGLLVSAVLAIAVSPFAGLPVLLLIASSANRRLFEMLGPRRMPRDWSQLTGLAVFAGLLLYGAAACVLAGVPWFDHYAQALSLDPNAVFGASIVASDLHRIFGHLLVINVVSSIAGAFLILSHLGRLSSMLSARLPDWARGRICSLQIILLLSLVELWPCVVWMSLIAGEITSRWTVVFLSCSLTWVAWSIAEIMVLLRASR